MTAVERRREVMTRYADWLNDERGKVLAFPTAKTVLGRGMTMMEEGDEALGSNARFTV